MIALGSVQPELHRSVQSSCSAEGFLIAPYRKPCRESRCEQKWFLRFAIPAAKDPAPGHARLLSVEAPIRSLHSVSGGHRILLGRKHPADSWDLVALANCRL